jgi:hypothetical protein
VQQLQLEQLTAPLLLLLPAGHSASNCPVLMPKLTRTQLATLHAVHCHYPLAPETQTQLLHPAAAAAWH